MVDVAAKLGEGRQMYAPQSFREVMIHQGFGLHRNPDDVVPPAVPAKMVNFYWPDSSDPDGGIVWGELSEETRERMEMAALTAILPLGQDAPMLWWRCLPEWESERDFERGEVCHKFRLRGAFVWNEPA